MSINFKSLLFNCCRLSSIMAVELYRNTTLGYALQETLDQMIISRKLPPSLASKLLIKFDRSMTSALKNRVSSRVTFRAEKVKSYRYIDNTWSLHLKNVEFSEFHELASVENVKIVASDASAGSGIGAHPLPKPLIWGGAQRSGVFPAQASYFSLDD